MEDNILKKYFRYTRDERTSLIIFCLLCLVFILIPRSFHLLFQPKPTTNFQLFQTEILQFQAQQEADGKLAFQERAAMKNKPSTNHKLFFFDPNTASKADFLMLGLSEKRANTIINYRNKVAPFQKPEDLQKIYGIEKDYPRLAPYIQIKPTQRTPKKKAPIVTETVAEPFSFNPNTASLADFERLGLSSKVAQSILNYRNAGGQFRQAEDFQKIYTLSSSDYERLVPFISIPDKITPNLPKAALTETKKVPELLVEKAAITTVDINKASIEDWKTLPGIGNAYAKRIVNFRDKLGGFTSIEQVSTTYYLPDSTYQKIRTQLVASPIFRKIKINSATAEELKQHPYIKWKAAERIVAYRNNHGAFADEAAFRRLHAFEDGFFEKIIPYLTFE